MSLRSAKSVLLHHPPLVAVLYAALLDMTSMRAALDEVRDEIAPSDAERLRFRLELLEHKAARLIETIEPPARCSH
jgi:hypothetical protein